ncbi:MotA/TolQ/ExbB proton channel family protein [Lignipirellula cremea]|uniref:Colicin uptake protein TolQ n=1 Tax=Lignipirellula cremea TaxID=2528010 RepID=A0A518E4U0_9BACT|nr:MotA/TolQ/ExbB proton channel family protein [Lignipirellula cremea]QDU99088.1 colicin uptake protein TolQ [Lignipirellula cremea]
MRVQPSPARALVVGLFAMALVYAAWEAVGRTPLSAQEASPGGSVAPASNAPVDPVPVAPVDNTPTPEDEGINLFYLLIDGGWFMVPIGMLSMVVVVITIERLLALRRSRVLPEELIARLTDLGTRSGGFDPRQAYRLCQQFPSASATIIKSMLLKVGRPHSEVEAAVAETSQREADRLYSNVRWLLLAGAVAPLLGLLGTVWGMIRAFHDTTKLGVGENKADFLAEGIYIALVTTLGGLVVGIAGTVASHLFEGRIQSLFREIDELLFNLLPQVERYEGRVRFSRQSAEGDGKMLPSGAEEEAALPARSQAPT